MQALQPRIPSHCEYTHDHPPRGSVDPANQHIHDRPIQIAV